MKKTLRSRIAAVAVGAVGLGLLQAAPASATVTALAGSITVTTPSGKGATTTAIASGTKIEADLKVAATGNLSPTKYIQAVYTIENPLGVDITSLCTFTKGTDPTNGTYSLTGSTIKLTAGANAVTAATFTFGSVSIPTSAVTVGGIYKVKVAITNDDDATVVATGLTSNIYVSGIGVTQGTTRGVDGAADTAGAAQVTFAMPEHAALASYRVLTSGVGTITGATAGNSESFTALSGVLGDYSKGLTITAPNNTNFTATVLSLSSSVAGVQTITAGTIDDTTGVFTKVYESNVTWRATSAPAGSTTAFISATLTGAAATVDDTYSVYAPATAGVQGAVISVSLKDQYGAASTGRKVTVTVAGAGQVTIATTKTGNNISTLSRGVTTTALAVSDFYVGVWGDGTSGDSTITIKDAATGFLIGEKKMKFYGKVAKLVSAARVSVIGNGNTTFAPFTVKAYDANDVLVNGAVLSGASTNDISVVTGWTCSARSATVYPGQYRCYATGYAVEKYGKVAPVFQDDQAVPVKSNAAEVTVGSEKIASLDMKFDKSTYKPGEKMVLTITAKDAAGNPVADVTNAANSDATRTWQALYTMTSNLGTSTNLADVTDGGFGVYNGYAAGTQEVELFAPTVSGSFSVTATIDAGAGNYAAFRSVAALYGAVKTATATVSQTAAEASADAAKAEAAKATAAVAAVQASVTAMQTAIASLVASTTATLTALAAQIAKIMKKLKIK